jgi:hypothetical protein
MGYFERTKLEGETTAGGRLQLLRNRYYLLLGPLVLLLGVGLARSPILACSAGVLLVLLSLNLLVPRIR